MTKRIIILIILIATSIGTWFINQDYITTDLSKVLYTLTALSILYFIFRIVFDSLVVNRLKDRKMRYSFRKATGILFFVTSAVIILRIWVVNPQALLVAYGLAAAGIAVSLQDFFKNFAGGIILFLTKQYVVGDRIEIDGNRGDVIDIGVLYTSLLEIGGWVSGDQATGRISLLPNGLLLSKVLQNYTKDHSFIWDEIAFAITYDSDWKKASKIVEKVLQESTNKLTEAVSHDIDRLGERYFFSSRNIEPAVYISLTGTDIGINARYVVYVKERRIFKDQLTRTVLEELAKEDQIKFVTASVTLSELPKTS